MGGRSNIYWRGKSELRRVGWLLTATEGDFRESATETRTAPFRSKGETRAVRAPNIARRLVVAGKPHPQQDYGPIRLLVDELLARNRADRTIEFRRHAW